MIYTERRYRGETKTGYTELRFGERQFGGGGGGGGERGEERVNSCKT